MSFLDNVENNLKVMESREEASAQRGRQRERPERQRAEALAIAENVRILKSSPYTNDLLSVVVRLGYARRMKVRITWIGNNLRLEAREKRLELQPRASGIVATFAENGVETRSHPVNLTGRAEELAREWLASA